MFFDSTPSPFSNRREKAVDMSGIESFLDRYEILSRVGDGGFGAVYKARHTLIGRTVAIKFLHEPAPDEVTMRRFQQEAQTAASLTHPNIVAVYDFGAAPDNRLYLIMDFVEGMSLFEAIGDAEHLEVERAVNIFIQTADALEHAHKRGIIHRDLKPSNIMLADDEFEGDFVKIVDFGLAKMITPDEQSEKLTKTGEMLGTPFYMSPEQCRGEHPDHRSDIYALGCIMYRSLSGQLPISGNNVLSTVYQHISKDPASFAQVAPELAIPRALEQAVFRAMQKNPADRYQSMAELGADLRKVRRALQQGGGEVSLKSIGLLLPKQRRRAWVVAASLALLAAAVGLFSTSGFWRGAPTAPVTAVSPTGRTAPAPRTAAGSAGGQTASAKPGKVLPARQATAATTGGGLPADAAIKSGVTTHMAPDHSGAGPSVPEPAPPRVAPSRYAVDTARSGGRAVYATHSADGPGVAPAFAPKGTKKVTKPASLTKKIGDVAGGLLSEGASGVERAGRTVGKAGKFLKDLVDDD